MNNLDHFEQLCRIIDKYLRWPLTLITIVALYCFLDPATAFQASCCVLAIGNSAAIKKLIDKIPQ